MHRFVGFNQSTDKVPGRANLTTQSAIGIISAATLQTRQSMNVDYQQSSFLLLFVHRLPSNRHEINAVTIGTTPVGKVVAEMRSV